MSWVEELKTNILLIIENYKNKFNDAPTFVDLIENDLEFEKVAQNLLVMHQISDYDGYTIIEQDDQNFRKWVPDPTAPVQETCTTILEGQPSNFGSYEKHGWNCNANRITRGCNERAT